MANSQLSAEFLAEAENNCRQFGATESRELRPLLPRHKSILCRLIWSIYQIGTAEAKYEEHLGHVGGGRSIPSPESQSPLAGRPSRYADSVEAREPIFAFLIDGPRGSGKTSLLRTTRYFLHHISQPGVDLDANLKNELRNEEITLQPIRVAGRERALVHPLPLLRPDHMEPTEAIMEGIFSQMSIQLGNIENNRFETDSRKRAARQLRQGLNSEVAKGWYFSRSMGTEALMNDSLNFDDYIERRAREAICSHERGAVWRRFVLEYLEFFEAELLGLFIDDTDILPHHTVDMLHSLRIFCCHPRIVSVVAGNLHAMRQRLLMNSMDKLSNPAEALRGPASYTAVFWRSFERENIEEHLEKVFPRPNRHFITIGGKEVEQILGASFSQFCSEQMTMRLKPFLMFRKTTRRLNAQTLRRPTSESPRKEDRNVENYLALWLLKHHYCDSLTPKSARYLNQFCNMISEPRQKRRVVVAVFTEPQNHPVLQRQTDRDSNALDWFYKQNVSARWRDARQITLNDLVLNKDMPAYDYLLYRLDLEIAKPEYAQQRLFPDSVLPVPAGNNLWAPEVWQTEDRTNQQDAMIRCGLTLRGDFLRLRQEVYGVAKGISSSVIPANCVYFKDLRAMPDVAWSTEEASDLNPGWGVFPIGQIDRLFRLDRYDTRNSYFRQIALMFGTFPLLAPIPADEFTNQTLQLLHYEICTLPANQLDDCFRKKVDDWKKTEEWSRIELAARHAPFFPIMQGALAERYRAAVAALGGRKTLKSDILQYFHPGKIGSEVERMEGALSKKALRDEEEELVTFEDAARIFISHVTPRYHRIVCDVRRATLALRVFEQDIVDYVRAGYPASWTPGFPFNLNQSDLFRLVGLEKLRAVLGLDLVSHEQRQEDGGVAGLGSPDDRYFSLDPQNKIQGGIAPWHGILKVRSVDGKEVAQLCWTKDGKAETWDIPNPESGKPRNFRLTLEEYFGRQPAGVFEEVLRQFLDASRIMSHNERSSLMRSLLLFLWGLGPCLSSIIHVDLMGEWYYWQHDKNQGAGKDPVVSLQCRKAMQDISNMWEFTLHYAICFICLFAAAMEANIERQFKNPDLMMPGGQTKSDQELFTPFPDFAISTLGLRLYVEPGKDRRDAFSGIIGDTLLRFELARWYLGEIREWIAHFNVGETPAQT